MKVAGNTVDYHGMLCPVYECEFCALRSLYMELLAQHEASCPKKAEAVKEHHLEEAKVGNL